MTLDSRFEQFCSALSIGRTERSRNSQRYKRITKRLNRDFWDFYSDTAFSRYVGSYGRHTAAAGESDLDIIFRLPVGLYHKYDGYYGNGQSALLQVVRTSILESYPSTYVGADGQVVAVPFSDGTTFEVVPVFDNEDGSFTYADTRNGGSWKMTNPLPEIAAVQEADDASSGNMKRLCRMARAWRNQWEVPIGGLLIDTLAANFLSTYHFRSKGYYYYDYMTRDFLKYLAAQRPSQSYWLALGSRQHVHRKGSFEQAATECAEIAEEAVAAEASGYGWKASVLWREIYGTRFPYP